MMPGDESARRRIDCLCVGAIVFLAFAIFADLLVLPGDAIASHISGDIARTHFAYREWGFEQLREGNLPLWNPYLFSGTPFFAAFHAALLYPLNIHYLFLPIAKALNFDLFMHMALLGLYTYAWARHRGLRAAGSFLAATLIMFSGPYSLRVLAGNIGLLAAFAWVPLLFLAVDKIFDTPHPGQHNVNWCLIGMAAAAMMVLAGYPLVVFMAALAVAIYSLLRLIACERRRIILLQLAFIGVAPLFLSAIQLWPGIAIGTETLRGDGTSYEFASSFSFPPENFLTLVAPFFFGDMIHIPAWSRWAYWDTSFFVGITGLTLLVYGVVHGNRRATRWCTPLIVLFTILALGPATSLHSLFFDWAPGFRLFRGASKFLLLSTLFGAILAGAGLDALMERPRNTLAFAIALFVLAVLAAAGAGWIYYAARGNIETSAWHEIVRKLRTTRGSLSFFTVSSDYYQRTAKGAVLGLAIAASTLCLCAALIGLAKNSRTATAVLFALALTELTVYARMCRGTFKETGLRRPSLERFYAGLPDKQRVYDIVGMDYPSTANHPLQVGSYGIWGYESVILARYAELISFVAGGKEHFEETRNTIFTYGGVDPLRESINRSIAGMTPNGVYLDTRILRMLRCTHIVYAPTAPRFDAFLNVVRVRDRTRVFPFQRLRPMPLSDFRNGEVVYTLSGGLPHFFLVNRYRVLQDRDAIFSALSEEAFDPRQSVILEQEPNPPPVPGEPQDSVELVESSSDVLIFKGVLTRPAILVVSDAYSKGWRATPLSGSTQGTYDVQPANYAMRAIALQAGKHHIRLEYKPAAFRYGQFSSFATATLLVFGAIYRLARIRRHRRTRAQ